MTHITIATATYTLNGREITYKGRGSFEVASQEDMADIMSGENGSIAKYSSLEETFTVSLPVILGSPDDGFLQSLFKNRTPMSGTISKPLQSLNGSLGSVNYDILNGVIQRSPSQTDSLTLDDMEAESVAIYIVKFVGTRTPIGL